MEFREVVRRRRMVRRFDPDRPVPRGTLEQVLYAAQRAPSAGFSQGWDFVVLADEPSRSRFWAASADPGRPEDAWLRGVSAAPVLVLCLSDPETYLDRYAEPDKGWTDRDPRRWPVPYWDVDTGMAALLMLLSAVDEGLGALFFGVPPTRHEAVRQAHGIPANRRLVGVVALGFERERTVSPSLRRGRRNHADVVHWGAYGESGETAPEPWERMGRSHGPDQE
ncbi:nitroreductase family protein [Nostocoides sp. HKS02]|uniref:nitroreductase family protein n=1 Tax=Nostocoides sp. HKS02 TaxID=1813880 RepID=UPI0012B443D4|nr:nitroreductase family protein [Tetrasphaera sp. HKS02]QGN57531.1 nitroreductase family protein [Tetrasphaera sp. HKS02]